MGRLVVCVTVDWEGATLDPNNLGAMTQFRQNWPGVPLTHFICPAYYTRETVDQWPGITNAILNGPVVPGLDEIGLHVHCWDTLVTASGVVYQPTPTWYDNDDPGPQIPYFGGMDEGHGVPLGLYAANDIAAILEFSRGLLLHVNLTAAPPISFRCGGWMSADNVLATLRNEGFRFDSSMTDAPYFAAIAPHLQGATPLGTWVSQLWGDQANAAPPYLANTLSIAVEPDGGGALTQPYAVANVLQVPDNGVLADYLTLEDMTQRMTAAFNLAVASPADVVYVCGFHQESAIFQSIWQDGVANLDAFEWALASLMGLPNAANVVAFARIRNLIGIAPAALAASSGTAHLGRRPAKRGKRKVIVPPGNRRFWG